MPAVESRMSKIQRNGWQHSGSSLMRPGQDHEFRKVVVQPAKQFTQGFATRSLRIFLRTVFLVTIKGLVSQQATCVRKLMIVLRTKMRVKDEAALVVLKRRICTLRDATKH
ncbi:hypothetical protein RB195_011266 [Necator americanus]|uniref:Uncharacterized protein n=1 Tax=Necator americanus TaxID=51031 RepID=A0ABR1D2Y6_NECAM